MQQTEFISAKLSLPEEILNHLTEDATRLYTKVWNLMRIKNRTQIWLSDKAASIVSRVDIDELHLAKQQLEDVGLFEIKPGRWSENDPVNICHRYRFAAYADTEALQ